MLPRSSQIDMAIPIKTISRCSRMRKVCEVSTWIKLKITMRLPRLLQTVVIDNIK